MVGGGGGDGNFFGVLGEEGFELFFAVSLLPVAEEDVELFVGLRVGEIDFDGYFRMLFKEFGDNFGWVKDGGGTQAEVGEEHVVDGFSIVDF